ncbi:MAG: hypothetical protein MRY21_05710 [Simkaniaceae bacterium]|nr:hypothetical protein [Simkaniaceae bacterium]
MDSVSLKPLSVIETARVEGPAVSVGIEELRRTSSAVKGVLGGYYTSYRRHLASRSWGPIDRPLKEGIKRVLAKCHIVLNPRWSTADQLDAIFTGYLEESHYRSLLTGRSYCYPDPFILYAAMVKNREAIKVIYLQLICNLFSNIAYAKKEEVKQAFCCFKLLNGDEKSSVYQYLTERYKPYSSLIDVMRLIRNSLVGEEAVEFVAAICKELNGDSSSFSREERGLFGKDSSSYFFTAPIDHLREIFSHLQNKLKIREVMFTYLADELLDTTTIGTKADLDRDSALFTSNVQRFFALLSVIFPEVNYRALFELISMESSHWSPDDVMLEFGKCISQNCTLSSVFEAYVGHFRSSLSEATQSKINREIFGFNTEDTKLVLFFSAKWDSLRRYKVLSESKIERGYSHMEKQDLPSLLPSSLEEVAQWVRVTLSDAERLEYVPHLSELLLQYQPALFFNPDVQLLLLTRLLMPKRFIVPSKKESDCISEMIVVSCLDRCGFREYPVKKYYDFSSAKQYNKMWNFYFQKSKDASPLELHQLAQMLGDNSYALRQYLFVFLPSLLTADKLLELLKGVVERAPAPVVEALWTNLPPEVHLHFLDSVDANPHIMECRSTDDYRVCCESVLSTQHFFPSKDFIHYLDPSSTIDPVDLMKEAEHLSCEMLAPYFERNKERFLTKEVRSQLLKNLSHKHEECVEDYLIFYVLRFFAGAESTCLEEMVDVLPPEQIHRIRSRLSNELKWKYYRRLFPSGREEPKISEDGAPVYILDIGDSTYLRFS